MTSVYEMSGFAEKKAKFYNFKAISEDDVKQTRRMDSQEWQQE